MGDEEVLSGGVEPGQFLERAAQMAGMGEDGFVAAVEQAGGGLTDFLKSGGVAGPLVFPVQFEFFLWLEAGVGNLLDLEPEPVELAGVGLFIDHQGGFVGFEPGTFGDEVCEGLACGMKIAEGVKDGELSGRMEERLGWHRRCRL